MSDGYDLYNFGETVTVEATFGAIPSVIDCTVLRPDGTTANPPVDQTHAPTYTAEIVADQAGTWVYRFEGNGSAEGVEEGYFVVAASPVLTGVPAYTYDPATAVGMVRLYTDDRDLSSINSSTPPEQRSVVWTDVEIEVFLQNNGWDPLLAAAEALTVLASNRQLLVRSRKIGQTTVDYGNIRNDLLSLAADYRKQAYAQAPASEFVEIAYNDFGARRIIENDLLRRN